MKTFILLAIFALPTFAQAARPSKHVSLIPYVQAAPDQGETDTCLYMASTGAVELIANKKAGIRFPKKFGKYDLSESYLINLPDVTLHNKSRYEYPVYRFQGEAVPAREWPTITKVNGKDDNSVWDWRDSSHMSRIKVPLVETIELFSFGTRYSTNILVQENVDAVKDALVKYNSPILINYNDDDYWHVILIVGYDDNLKGDCYQITKEECKQTKGSFYVRDSFGKRTEIRDQDWFKIRANSAFVVKEADSE